MEKFVCSTQLPTIVNRLSRVYNLLSIERYKEYDKKNGLILFQW